MRVGDNLRSPIKNKYAALFVCHECFSHSIIECDIYASLSNGRVEMMYNIADWVLNGADENFYVYLKTLHSDHDTRDLFTLKSENGDFCHFYYKNYSFIPVSGTKHHQIPMHIPKEFKEQLTGQIFLLNKKEYSLGVCATCRQIIESALKDKFGTSSKWSNLKTIIKDAKLPDSLSSWADAVREKGNRIHEPLNSKSKPNPALASEMFYFTCVFLQYMYTLPHLIKEHYNK